MGLYLNKIVKAKYLIRPESDNGARLAALSICE